MIAASKPVTVGRASSATIYGEGDDHCKRGIGVWVGGTGVILMRGFAGLLAYLVGVSAIISIGVVGLTALQSPTERTPSTPTVAAASHRDRGGPFETYEGTMSTLGGALGFTAQ